MSNQLNRETLERLAAPFPLDAHYFKPGVVSGDRAMALVYVDSRQYMRRLDDVVGPHWEDHTDTEVTEDGVVLTCTVTIHGRQRGDVGEEEARDDNTATSASAQAFKRACSKWGVGRYLYDVPKIWADFDPESGRFTRGGYKHLRNKLAQHLAALSSGNSTPATSQPSHGTRSDGGSNGGNGAAKVSKDEIPSVSDEATRRARSIKIDFGKYAPENGGSVTLGEIYDRDHHYVAGYLAEKAQERRVRLAAMYLAQLNGKNGNGKMSLDAALSVEMPFGTRNNPELKGKPLRYVNEHHADLMEWLIDNAKSHRLREAAEVIVASRN